MLDLDYVEDKVPDYIQLGELGWASRYYDVHFHLKDRNKHESHKYIMNICEHYMRGMMWTLQYYLTNEPDWYWEYPFHSAPTVHDLFNYMRAPNNNLYQIYEELMYHIANGHQSEPHESFQNLNNPLKLYENKPVSPLEQLMCILPPASAHLLPLPAQNLIKSESLAVYYPHDFALDIFGYRYRWESHPLLPNIPTDEIRSAIKSIEPYLTQEEIDRNSIGKIFVI